MRVIQNFQTQNFGNLAVRQCCQVHCAHDGMLFAELYWVVLEIGTSVQRKRDIAKVAKAISQELLISRVPCQNRFRAQQNPINQILKKKMW